MQGNSEQYNLSVSNVKQYLFEGRKKLKEGMDMVREYGRLSYAPEKFTMIFGEIVRVDTGNYLKENFRAI